MKSLGGLVTYFSRTEVLDRAGEDILGIDGPVSALGSETLERCAIDTYESLLYNGLHLTVTTFHIEHHRDWNTTCEPLY